MKDWLKKIFINIYEISRGFLILMALYFFADLILKLFKITFPPAILGLIFLFIGLNFKIIKENWIDKTANFLLKNMALFFVPFIVGVVVYKSTLLKIWLPLLIIVFGVTAITIIVTGLYVEYGIKFLRMHKMFKSGITHQFGNYEVKND